MRIHIDGLHEPLLTLILIGGQKPAHIAFLGIHSDDFLRCQKIFNLRIAGRIQRLDALPCQVLFQSGEISQLAGFGNFRAIVKMAQIQHSRRDAQRAVAKLLAASIRCCGVDAVKNEVRTNGLTQTDDGRLSKVCLRAQREALHRLRTSITVDHNQAGSREFCRENFGNTLAHPT